MSGELVKAPGHQAGQELERSGGVVQHLLDGVTYLRLVAQLTLAGIRLRWLSGSVRATYEYIKGCADGVDRLADQMASLEVDNQTTSEHHNAATVMRSVLADADAMASELEDLSTLFDKTGQAHRSEYGPVADAINRMPVPMAKAEFYSNR